MQGLAVLVFCLLCSALGFGVAWLQDRDAQHPEPPKHASVTQRLFDLYGPMYPDDMAKN